jgi:thiol-disulfide isomerase/thioredoxin
VIEYRGREEAIGRPFNLEFDDVMTGRHISIKQRRGKIVVIDLWATWCSPCVKEIPGLKEQYAKYRDSEVQLISKSLDHPVEQGGRRRSRSTWQTKLSPGRSIIREVPSTGRSREPAAYSRFRRFS